MAAPDKLDLAVPWALARKDGVDVGYSRTDRKPAACVMSLNTGHIQIKVTQLGLYVRGPGEHERERERARLDSCFCCLTS